VNTDHMSIAQFPLVVDAKWVIGSGSLVVTLAGGAAASKTERAGVAELPYLERRPEGDEASH